jgi:glycosyltransferase involved in cell wall biosynthesis
MSSKPIKILHLIPTLTSGGAERQLVNVVRGTSKELIDHVVCVINESDFFAPYIREAGYRVIDLNIPGKRPFLRTARAFRKIIAAEKPDIIHTRLYNASISARLAVLSGRAVPLITSLELGDYEPEIIRVSKWNPHKMRGLKAIDKITSLLTRPYYVPCSEFVRNSYRRNYGLDDEKTQVIYNSVDPQALAADAGAAARLRREFHLPEDAFIYLNVGRLDQQKNHRLLFEAFSRVAAGRPDAFLLLAGVGNLEAELKTVTADLGIDKQVMFLGRRNDIGALLELADVFVFPSLFEGHPVALIEAMFKSVPCIASRIEVFEEVVVDRETGLLIDPGSAAELKEAMLELYDNAGLRGSLGENACRQVKTKYTLEVIISQWEDFYGRVKTSD